SEFDPDLVAGIEALRSHQTQVVLDAKDWQLGDDGRPNLSKGIPATIPWGAATARVDPRAVWSAQLAVERQGDPTLPSLSLAAAATYLWPPGPLSYDLVPRGVEVIEASGRQQHFVRATLVEQCAAPDPRAGLAEGDFAAHSFIPIPSDADLK